jgi:hypothetical protein
MTKKYLNKHSTFLAIKEMQIKKTLSYHFILVRMAIINNTTNAGEDSGEKGTLGEPVNP